jgi:hypothetical protein
MEGLGKGLVYFGIAYLFYGFISYTAISRKQGGRAYI